MADPAALIGQLDAARAAFLELLAKVDAELMTAPGAMDDWSVRDIVAHVAAWNEHGTGALALAATGRGGEFAYSREDTDAMNARFLEEGRALSATDALRREDSSFRSFRGAIRSLESSLVDERLGNGDTVEQVVRYDGPDHYAEHTAHLRAWLRKDDEQGLAENPGRG